MKLFLFKTVASTAAALVASNIAIGNTISATIVFVFNSISRIIKSIAAYLMITIDRDRYEHAVLTMEQFPQLVELNLLMAASRVKEHAIAQKSWTFAHTAEMNRIGNALYSNCNWEPARVHKYLKSVIESIPGMVYMAGDDFDDKMSV